MKQLYIYQTRIINQDHSNNDIQIIVKKKEISNVKVDKQVNFTICKLKKIY